MSLFAAEASISLRWWPGQTREYGMINGLLSTSNISSTTSIVCVLKSTEKFPCRLSIRFTGLQVVFVNRRSWSRSIYEKVLSKMDNKEQKVELPPMQLPEDFELPLLFRVAPNIEVTVTRGAVIVGQPDLPVFGMATFSKCLGVLGVLDPSSEYDYYKRQINMDFDTFKFRVCFIS